MTMYITTWERNKRCMNEKLENLDKEFGGKMINLGKNLTVY